MKKIIFLLCFSACNLIVNAQSWMPQNPNGPVKFSDVVANYKNGNVQRHPETNLDNDHPGQVMKEGEDYLFERWAWYWRQHLDKNGYMVSPVKNVNEWNNYLASHPRNSQRTMDTSNCNWQFQGPDSCGGGYHGVGRINCVRFDPVDTYKIYAGTAGGGPWMSADGGTTWKALYSNMVSAGVSDICINPQNTSSIYVCTGDGDGTDDYSIGIIKSNDGGTTWVNTGLVWSESALVNANSMVINVQDTNTLITATSIGIYISHNAGASWTNVKSGNFKQVLYNPADTTVVYATTYGSSSSAEIFTSTDGGNTWTQVTSFSDCIRIALAVTPANPTEVVALAANYSNAFEGLYVSLLDGSSFTPVFVETSGCTNNLLGYELGLPTTTCDGQGWYDLALAVDPSNANNIIVGGINNYYSTDGGNTWSLVTQWYYDAANFTVATIHADKHCLAYNPLNNWLFETADGGIYNTNDIPSTNWNDLTTGMGITEFYRCALGNGVSWCIGGAQDNGTKRVDGHIATDLQGGDGMACAVDYGDPTYQTFYTSNPNGAFSITTNGGASFTGITGDTLVGDWVTPFLINPVNDAMILAGYNKLYVSYDIGASWIPSSPQFNNGYNINNITIPYTNSNFIWVSDDANTLHFSPNSGATWSTIRITIPIGGNTISRLLADPVNDSAVWVTFAGYGDNKVAKYDLGTNTWTTYNTGLPAVPVNCIIIDTTSLTKYIGTDVSVFYMDTTMTSWEPYNTNLPAVIVNDLQINYSTNLLWAATYGRSFWNTLKKDIPNGISIIPYAADVITISPNPSKGNFNIHTTNLLLSGSAVTVKLMAVNGNIVWKQDCKFDNNGNIAVSGINVPIGNYICEVGNASLIARNKLTIK